MNRLLLLLLIASSPFVLSAQSGKGRPFFDKKTIGEIRLTLADKNWSDQLDSMRLYGAGMLTGTAVVDGSRYEGVGIRFRGDKSYVVGQKRNPFTIKLDYSISGQNHQGCTSIKLSSAMRDPSMVREVLFYEIASKYMPAPQANYTKLYINDEYVGLFVNVESIDAQFFSSHYGSDTGPAFKAGVDYPSKEVPAGCKQNIFGSLEYEENLNCYKHNYESNVDWAWGDLQNLTKVLSSDPSKAGTVLDVDRALWMLALNNVMINLSSYSGYRSINYYLYKDENGHFQVIPWDLNLSFGSFKNPGVGLGSDLELKDLQTLDPLLHSNNPYKPLISQLLQDPLNKKIYLAHIRQINEENFLNGDYEKRAKELQGMIVIPFNEDKNKLYSLDEFQRSLKETIGKRSKIPGIVELMSKRSRYLKTHPDLTALPSSVSDVSVQGRGKFDNQRLNTFNISCKVDRFPKRVFVYYRFSDKSPYMVMPMNEESANGLPSGVKMFSAAIEAKNEDAVLDYYLLTENAGTVSFMPSNYMQKPYKVRLKDLNK